MLRGGVLLAAVLVVAMPSTPQSNAPSNAAGRSLNIPSSMAIEAKLQTDLDASKNKPGDLVQADTVRDLKRGHDVLLKKGSRLIGNMVKVQTASGGAPSMIVIAFEQVTPAGGQPESLNALIAALAPAPTLQTDSLQDGRGMQQTSINAVGRGIRTWAMAASLWPPALVCMAFVE